MKIFFIKNKKWINFLVKSFFIKKINKVSLVPLFEKLDLGKSNIQSSSKKYNCENCHIVYPIGTLLKRLGGDYYSYRRLIDNYVQYNLQAFYYYKLCLDKGFLIRDNAL